MAGDLAQIAILGRAQPSIGKGDVEQPAEQVLQHAAIPGEHAADLAGVTLEARGALAGKIEDQPQMRLLTRRHLEHLAEGGDLVAGHSAVRLGHLGAQRDHGDGESDAVPGIGAARRAATPQRAPLCAARQAARRALHQGTERTAQGQVAGAGDDPANDAHESRGWSNKFAAALVSWPRRYESQPIKKIRRVVCQRGARTAVFFAIIA